VRRGSGSPIFSIGCRRVPCRFAQLEGIDAAQMRYILHGIALYISQNGGEDLGTKRAMISLPDDLKQRMEKAGSNVNWSAIARQAFEETLSRIETPTWSEVSIQLFDDEAASDVVSMDQYVIDNSLALGLFMTNCKEGRHDDAAFRNWYQEMREAAHATVVALEKLQSISNRYKTGRKPR
jgi:hypothetical protein